MHSKDKPKKLSNDTYSGRLAQEYAAHIEDELEASYVTNTPHSNGKEEYKISDAVLSKEQETIRKKRTWAWIIISTTVLHKIVRSTLHLFIPLFAHPTYSFISDMIEVFVIGLVAVYLFSSFNTKLFRD